MLATLQFVKYRSPRSVPDALPIRQVLTDCDALVRLQQRLKEANARMDAIRSILPPALHACVRAGPPDDEGWTLLVANTAVAAKLRQLVPRLEQVLRQQGWQSNAIRVRVQS